MRPFAVEASNKNTITMVGSQLRPLAGEVRGGGTSKRRGVLTAAIGPRGRRTYQCCVLRVPAGDFGLQSQQRRCP